jgi:hypothetical protein
VRVGARCTHLAGCAGGFKFTLADCRVRLLKPTREGFNFKGTEPGLTQACRFANDDMVLRAIAYFHRPSDAFGERAAEDMLITGILVQISGDCVVNWHGITPARTERDFRRGYGGGAGA